MQKAEKNKAIKNIKKRKEEQTNDSPSNPIIPKDMRYIKIKRTLQIFGIVVGLFTIFGVIYNCYNTIKNDRQIKILINEKIVLLTITQDILKSQSGLIQLLKKCDENEAIAHRLEDQINYNISNVKKMMNGLCKTSIKIINAEGEPIPDVRLSISDILDTISDKNGNINLWIEKSSYPLGKVRIQATKSNYIQKTVHERICKEIIIKLNKKSK